ncbi:methionyl-tRNA formyltransferase [Streptomyces sp. AV19]|uniref:methionyl-tRNA formyltransferase n=1 Tax=Streptomyces sp. AV19 TaxID=2793068 RepID=UPI0018FE2ADE|nr:methionyl-tRNA formyltransferase [Streptomyces sp. AV19]MBH1937093.1 methionyl-tRNA formyltransferase [Streptomyces sp. AV19]MDG4533119.1 methionyl-tRNA formyltransferase [Streptomyces sp. AV19]
MRTVFLGYGEIGATVLGPLTEHHEVVAVLTHRPSYAGLGEDHVVKLAEKLGLPVHFARHADEPQVLPVLRQAAPEVLVSTNWRTRISETVLRIPSRCPVNVHDALLPGYAGFGAVNWTIRNGETRTGLTAHVMDPELDTGPVLHSVVVPIGDDETAGSVYAAMLRAYPGAVLTALDRVAHGEQPVPQPTTGSSFYHRITEADTRIDWSLSTTRLFNLIRAQSDPFLNAWCTAADGRKLYVKRAKRPVRAYRGTPGRVVRHAEGGVAVSCGPSWAPGSDGIILLEAQWEGDRPGPAEKVLPRLGVQLT